jgi:hypothetical protein
MAARLTAHKNNLVKFFIEKSPPFSAQGLDASRPRMAMTVLFRPPNLNMAVCLFCPVLGPKRMIWAAVVAIQQSFA